MAPAICDEPRIAWHSRQCSSIGKAKRRVTPLGRAGSPAQRKEPGTADLERMAAKRTAEQGEGCKERTTPARGGGSIQRSEA